MELSLLFVSICFHSNFVCFHFLFVEILTQSATLVDPSILRAYRAHFPERWFLGILSRVYLLAQIFSNFALSSMHTFLYLLYALKTSSYRFLLGCRLLYLPCVCVFFGRSLKVSYTLDLYGRWCGTEFFFKGLSEVNFIVTDWWNLRRNASRLSFLDARAS